MNSCDDAGLAQVVGRLLKERRMTLATAESCTGGLVAKWLTDVSGSSAYFHYGWVTYSNAAKTNELGVESKLIESHGAVSVEVARAMAEGALERSSSDLALSITGIAGPDGGTESKPVGTVCIALAMRGVATDARAFRFSGDRKSVRNQSAQKALQMVREVLSE